MLAQHVEVYPGAFTLPSRTDNVAERFCQNGYFHLIAGRNYWQYRVCAAGTDCLLGILCGICARFHAARFGGAGIGVYFAHCGFAQPPLLFPIWIISCLSVARCLAHRWWWPGCGQKNLIKFAASEFHYHAVDFFVRRILFHSLAAPFWQALSRFNPFFYMIDGFRYGFFGGTERLLG